MYQNGKNINKFLKNIQTISELLLDILIERLFLIILLKN